MWQAIIAGIQAGASFYSGYKKKQAADYNAGLIEDQGFLDRQRAYDQSLKLSEQAEAFLGQQRSVFASSGVKVDKGSTLQTVQESRRNLQQDISRTRMAGDSAYTLALNNAKSLREQGTDAFYSSIMGGATSFLSSLY